MMSLGTEIGGSLFKPTAFGLRSGMFIRSMKRFPLASLIRNVWTALHGDFIEVIETAMPTSTLSKTASASSSVVRTRTTTCVMVIVSFRLVPYSHYFRRTLVGLDVLMNLRLQQKVLFHSHAHPPLPWPRSRFSSPIAISPRTSRRKRSFCKTQSLCIDEVWQLDCDVFSAVGNWARRYLSRIA